jgi:hypothetical protein
MFEADASEDRLLDGRVAIDGAWSISTASGPQNQASRVVGAVDSEAWVGTKLGQRCSGLGANAFSRAAVDAGASNPSRSTSTACAALRIDAIVIAGSPPRRAVSMLTPEAAANDRASTMAMLTCAELGTPAAAAAARWARLRSLSWRRISTMVLGIINLRFDGAKVAADVERDKAISMDTSGHWRQTVYGHHAALKKGRELRSALRSVGLPSRLASFRGHP